VSTSPNPKLDFDLLAEIRRRTEVPLVLHGGSGIPVDQVQKAIGMDVAKMNIGTAIHVAFKEGMEEGLAANPGSHDIMKILSGCQARVRGVLRQYVDITMSAGRAA
jgi:tagatose 1,6-diphosphate aldolase GatY/KbaY